MKLITILVTIILSTTTSAFNFASPNEPSGQIVLNTVNNAKQLFPLKLLMINGENINVRSDTVWLAPGEYELRFGTTINNDYTKHINGLKERRGLKNINNHMTIKVEANKTYFVAFDASSTQSDEWQPVVYKTK